jgi:hypothetical protein
MCFRTVALALCVALAAADPLVAQAPADTLGPHGGSWAAEASYGGGNMASLLHFSSPSAAWLLGLGFSISRETADTYTFPPPPSPSRRTTTAGAVNLRIGRRWWTGDVGAPLRPFVGAGVSGGLQSSRSNRSADGSVYGELGASHFFTPHFSLGASGDLRLGYSRLRGPGGPTGDFVTDQAFLYGNLVHINATVYF